MRKWNFKGRCEKRQMSKCKGICKTYDKIQAAYAVVLQENPEIKSFQCNVLLQGISDNQYVSDFVAEKTDGSTMDRECVWRSHLTRPTVAKLLDMSRSYWLSKGVEDWGIAIEKEAVDEGE